MTVAVRSLPSISTLLKLGRVSNLPTVLTNVVAGTVLSGAPVLAASTLAVALAMSAFYVGGMYLNDAFDRGIDARERPRRPLPAGKITAATVYAIGFGLLAPAVGLMTLLGPLPGALAVLLATTIVVYDCWHKGNASSPVIMGLCRALVYVGAAAAATSSVGTATLIWALALAAHIAGITYAAKQESLDRVGRLWPLVMLAAPLFVALPSLMSGGPVSAAFLLLFAADALAVRMIAARSVPGAVPKAVGALIAATSLVDALAVSTAGSGVALVAFCFAGFLLTHILQRVIPGT